MKVMVVCTTGGSGRRQLGGAEHFLIDMLPALVAAGVDVVAVTPDDAVGAALRAAGVPWIEAGARSRIDLSYVREIRRLLREVRPDVVCAHLLSAAMHCRAALGVEHRRTPLVVTLHSVLWQFRDAATGLKGKAAVQANITLDLMLRRLRPHATVAVSRFEAEQLRARGRVRDVWTIPSPLPPTWTAPAGLRTPDPASEPVRVGYLGRLEPEKGADLLGDVARAMPDVAFEVAGAGTVAVPALPNVTLLGHVRPAEFLPRLDCLLVPSRVEAFGRSAVEALSLGVPVVHSGSGGLAEVTRPAEGVLAFHTELTPAAITAALRKATGAGTPVGERLAIAERYQREYAFARAVERWIELYRSVSHGSR